MTIYAEINDRIVVNIIVADENFVSTQTNKNYVVLGRGGIGWTFDGTSFIAPQPYQSWTLDENNDWQPPTPMPSDASETKRYRWSEEDLEWVAI